MRHNQREHYFLSVFLIFITLLISYFATDWVSLGTTHDNLRAILTTLVSSAAAILAIVFTIILFTIELSASQYYSYAGFYYTRTSIFRITFLSFVFSVATWVFFLANIQTTWSQYLIEFVTLYSIIIAAVILCILFVFIHEMIKLSSPVGLLDLIENQEPMKKETNGISTRIYAVYSVIQSSISKGDPATAFEGLKTYEDVLLDSLQTEDSDEKIRTDGGHPKKLVTTALKNHLPIILIKSDEANQPEIVDAGLELYLSICKMISKNKPLEKTSYSGLNRVLRKTSDESYLARRTWDSIIQLLIISSESYVGYLPFDDISEQLYSISLSSSAGVDKMTELLDKLPEIADNLFRDKEGFWNVLATRSFSDLIEDITKYIISESSSVKLEHELARSLANISITMVGRGVPDSTGNIYSALLEGAIISAHKNKNRMGIWAEQIAKLYEHDEVDIFFDEYAEKEYGPFIIDLPEYSPFEELESNKEIIRELQQRVHEINEDDGI